MPSSQPSLPSAAPGAVDAGVGAPAVWPMAVAALGLMGLTWHWTATDAGSPWFIGLMGLAVCLPPLWLGLQLRRQTHKMDALALRLQLQDAQLQALARSAELLRQAEQVAQLGSFDWDPVSGALHWSDEHFRLWGHAPGALAPDYAAFRAGIHPDDLAALEVRLQHALQTGGQYEFNHRVCWPDGKVLAVRARGDVTLDLQGRAVRMVGTVQDVTRQQSAEARLQMHEFVVNTIADPVSVIDEHRVYMLVNRAWCQASGLAAEDTVGKPTGDLQLRVSSVERDAAFQRCVHGGRTEVVLAELDLPGAGRRWWETTMYPFTEPNTGQRGAALISRDVTARQRAALALEASADSLRMTLNATGDAIFASSAANAHEPLLFANDRMLDMWGIPPDQAGQLTTAKVMAAAMPHFTDPAREAARVVEVIASGTVQEDRLSLRDGRVLLRRCIPTQQAGQPVRVWGFRDITIESRALAGLRAAEAQQRALLAAFPGHIACIDSNLRYTHVNARLAALLETTPQALIGRSVAEVVGPQRAPQLIHRIARAMDGEVQSFERLQPATDERPAMHLLITLARGVDRATGQVQCHAFGTDITALKRTEADLVAARDDAERANLAKSAFLSRMSHELRTPMNSVLGFAQLLQDDSRAPLAPHQQAQVREIVRGGQHLLTLINDLLDLARIDADHLAVQLQPVDLHRLLADGAALLAPAARERGIAVQLPPDMGLRARADPTRLRQVLLNLLGNALKYTHEGGCVQLGCEADGPWLRLTVTDDGPGIDPALQHRLFQPFDRLGAEGSAVEGAGIGLSLSQRLVALMGGEIGLDSAPGAGCCFWVRLAAAAPPDMADGQDDAATQAGEATPEAASGTAADSSTGPARDSGPGTAPAAAAAAASGTAWRVLYIDDNPVNTLLMAAMFERLHGLVLQCEGDPHAGVARALADPPALLLVDIQMPGIDGFEVLRQLRAAPATRAVPAIAVSANAMPQDLARGQAAGFADYLTKPLEPQRLLSALQAALPGWSAGSP